MSALWLLKVQTSKNLPFIAVVSLRPCFIEACASASVCFWSVSTLVCFLVVWELQEGTIFSLSFQRLLVPTKGTDLHKGRVHASTTPTHSTRHCQKTFKESDPNQTGRALQETKTMRDKHPNQPHMKVSVRPERGVEMQREFMGIRNELWGGQPRSRVNFIEGPK